jgi:hemerythrin-like domain-containing protein
MTTIFPGLSTPAAGFDEPFEMLNACHDRVRRSLDLLRRLSERVAEGRIDEAVRSAARDVLRYFDIAAPHHHEDEERHVFPLVLSATAEPDVHDAIQVLRWEHDEMRRRWAALRVALERLAAGDDSAFGEAEREAAAEYIALYERHADKEERLVFPTAARAATADQLEAIGIEMAQRRGAPLPPRRAR